MIGVLRALCVSCVVMSCACAGTAQPDSLIDEAPGSAQLFARADEMITSGDADGAAIGCDRARRALALESPEGDDAAGNARAAFCDAEVERVRWEALRLDSQDISELKNTLDAKLEGLHTVRAGYQMVFTFEVMEWTYAAGVREAGMYEHFGEVLITSTTPQNLSEEAAKMYREQIAGVAEPMFADARKRYALIVDRADEEGFTSAYIELARAKITESP